MGTECEHFEQAKDVNPITKGCEECEKEKTPWVAIRMCLTSVSYTNLTLPTTPYV